MGLQVTEGFYLLPPAAVAKLPTAAAAEERDGRLVGASAG